MTLGFRHFLPVIGGMLALATSSCSDRPRFSEQQLLNMGYFRVQGREGTFQLFNTKVKTAAKELGFKLTELKPFPNTPDMEGPRYAHIPGFEVRLFAKLEGKTHPDSLSNPETICDVLLVPRSK